MAETPPRPPAASLHPDALRLLDASADPALLVAADARGAPGLIQHVNPAFVRLTGWSAAAAIGRPTHLEPAAAIFDAAPPDGPWTVSAPMRRETGEEAHVAWSVAPLAGPDGRPSHHLALGRDVSRAVAADRILRTAVEQAQAGLQAKSEFLAMISHELRTPLNQILGFAELIEARADPDADAGFAGHILRSSRLLLGLVNDLLDYARGDARAEALEETAFDLAEVARETLLGFGPQAAAAGVRLALDASLDAPCTMLGDRRRMVRAVQNLVGNAVKFNRADGEVRLSLSAPPGAAARLTVADDGPGIAPEDQARVFDPFVQVAGSLSGRPGRRDGVGLGLAIARQAVEQHGGALTLESARGAGARFTIELPAARRLG